MLNASRIFFQDTFLLVSLVDILTTEVLLMLEAEVSSTLIPLSSDVFLKTIYNQKNYFKQNCNFRVSLNVKGIMVSVYQVLLLYFC